VADGRFPIVVAAEHDPDVLTDRHAEVRCLLLSCSNKALRSAAGNLSKTAVTCSAVAKSTLATSAIA